MLAVFTHPASLTVTCVIGIGLVAWGVIGRKPLHPECRRCRHDLTGVDTLRCPECGWFAATARDLTRRRRRRACILVGCIASLLGAYGLARRVPATWWLAHAPTPALLLVAGRFFDESTQFDIADELDDRAVLSDGLLAWSTLDDWSGWERDQLLHAIARLESKYSGGRRCLALRDVAGMSLRANASTLQAPPDVWLPGTPSELVESLIAAAASAPDRESTEPDSPSLAIAHELEALGIPWTASIPLGDEAKYSVERIPCDGPEAATHAVLRICFESFVGWALWFRREADGRWRLAARPFEIEAAVAYRMDHENVRVHAFGNVVLLEEIYAGGGGSGYACERTRVTDLSRGAVVLDVPRGIESFVTSFGQEISVALEWPSTWSFESLDARFRVMHHRNDAPLAGAAGVVTFRFAPDGSLREHAVQWTAPPPGLSDRIRPPTIRFTGWGTSAAEQAAMYGVSESAFELP